MKVNIPPSLLKADDQQAVVDAVYFVVRTLRNVLRNYPEAKISTESSPEAYLLAKIALQEIQNLEKEDIKNLKHSRIISYISKLQSFVLQQTMSETQPLRDEARNFLQQMRASKH